MNESKYLLKLKTVRDCLKGKLVHHQAAKILGCTSRTISRYKACFLERGPQELVDWRSSKGMFI